MGTRGYQQGKENLAEIHSLDPAQESVIAFGATFPHSAHAGDTTPNSDSCLLYTSATRKEEGWIKKRKVMKGEEGTLPSSRQPTEMVKEPCLYFHI